MKRIDNIHNKTKEIDSVNLPYNNKNVLLNDENLRELFDSNGLNGLKYKNINLYRVAFVHKSYCTMKNIDFNKSNINCPSDCLPLQDVSYERLEFLGDSLLGMIVANYLYSRFPDQNEGFLSKIRTKLVNGKMLGYLSDKIGFPKFAIISKQVEDSNGRNNYKIMEDIFEAFIGALYLDYQSEDDEVILPKNIKLSPMTGVGYYVVESWLIYIIENYIDFSELIRVKNNYKDMLTSHMQNYLQDIPQFKEISVSTRDNYKIFNYCVKDRNGTIISTSTGKSKKEAENNAALEALKYYNINVNEYNSNI
jgi:ribonuclease III|tara:strand:+ start:1624 stop:2547 length:924 start_codon:yes stop_codon:yes gene_type:complete